LDAATTSSKMQDRTDFVSKAHSRTLRLKDPVFPWGLALDYDCMRERVFVG